MRDWLPSFEDLLVGARFMRRLPPYLRHPVGVEEARAILRGRVEHRERDFLGLAKRGIFENPESPYGPLLKLAGCEYGDLEGLVGHDGIEGALRTLCRHGVYLTVDEFKGRRAIARGSATIAPDPGRLGNPLATAHVPARSGGSRSAGTAVLIDLAFFREHAVDACLVYGQPRLRLLVRPEVGPVDADLVVETFLGALGAGSGAERVMELLWREAGLLRVERRAPLTTAAGKILHLHVSRPSVERTTRAE